MHLGRCVVGGMRLVVLRCVQIVLYVCDEMRDWVSMMCDWS